MRVFVQSERKLSKILKKIKKKQAQVWKDLGFKKAGERVISLREIKWKSEGDRNDQKLDEQKHLFG